MASAKEIIRTLHLAPHPEGGWYRETWRAPAPAGRRSAGTAIYYLLEAHQYSHWHRVDAAEIWLWHMGAPLALTVSADGHDAEATLLGPELTQGQRQQVVVPADTWQTAASLGRFTLVSCVVTPGFEFSGFELAPADWRPQPRPSEA
ncbi:cupin domain-containing protein [Pikeienuella piscinae]|uniref:Cupin domain-containing protein n=1 Tax=Pikeienuella piscinae TaxID=2748098 RepID=A0A7L5BYJ7_9RHOB|nr:cupin domain-containing protein [Pikeienuella piscinae]QIE54679.1 cupin domain-containing protein [Pikeienuella piscinae]